MYLLSLFSLSAALFLGSAHAEDLQLPKLFCAIRDGKFLTHLEFKNQVVSDHAEMTGEISNYLIQSDGSRKYISGLLFTHISSTNNRVSGDTGDPSDLIGMFSLTRLDSLYSGRWSYLFKRSESEIIKATFNCSYTDIPPTWRHDHRTMKKPHSYHY